MVEVTRQLLGTPGCSRDRFGPERKGSALRSDDPVMAVSGHQPLCCPTIDSHRSPGQEMAATLPPDSAMPPMHHPALRLQHKGDPGGLGTLQGRPNSQPMPRGLGGDEEGSLRPLKATEESPDFGLSWIRGPMTCRSQGIRCLHVSTPGCVASSVTRWASMRLLHPVMPQTDANEMGPVQAAYTWPCLNHGCFMIRASVEAGSPCRRGCLQPTGESLWRDTISVAATFCAFPV